MAAPTSSNEVTVGQLSKVLVGSDGNGGMWKKVKDLAGTKSDTTHTHSVKINGSTKTIAASGGTAVDLGTYLTSHQTIKQDGITGATVNRFGTCSTAAGTAAKTVSITSGTFSLEAGATVAVNFSNANTASTPTLAVGSTAAKNIFVNGAQITTSAAAYGLLKGTVIFIYDGTQYHLIGNYYNSTYNFSGTTFYSGNQSNAEHNADNIVKNGNYYYSSNGPSTTLGADSANDGAIYAQSYSDDWVGQIAQDYRTGNLFVRGKKNKVWQSWLRIPTAAAQSVGNSTTPVYMAATGKLTALSYTIATSVPSGAVFTDTKVTQTDTDTSTSGQFRLLMSGTADDTTRTEGARKSTYAWFSPSSQTLGSQKFSVAGGCTLQYNSTTQSLDFVF